MSDHTPTLHMVCGKIAAGKSTLAAELGHQPGTVVISEDAWLHTLFGDQMSTGADFVRCSDKLRHVLGPHITSMLKAGVSVVLDGHANTIASRLWMRGLFEAAGADHRLHVLDASDDLCLARLHARNAGDEHPFKVTDAQFRQFTKAYAPPTENEGFQVIVHRAA